MADWKNAFTNWFCPGWSNKVDLKARNNRKIDWVGTIGWKTLRYLINQTIFAYLVNHALLLFLCLAPLQGFLWKEKVSLFFMVRVATAPVFFATQQTHSFMTCLGKPDLSCQTRFVFLTSSIVAQRSQSVERRFQKWISLHGHDAQYQICVCKEWMNESRASQANVLVLFKSDHI